MFAPPDPSTPAVSLPGPTAAVSTPRDASPTHVVEGTSEFGTPPRRPPPPAPLPTLPTLPSAGSATTLTPSAPAASRETAAAPSLVPPIETPAESAFTPHLAAAAPPIVHPPEAGALAANPAEGDISPRHFAGPDERPAAPRRSLRTSWLRRTVFWGNIAVIPGVFIGDLVGAGLVALSTVALIVWSGVVAANVRRARPATRHGSSPHPAAVALSWFVAPTVALVASVALAVVINWADSATFEEEGNRMLVLTAAVFVSGLAILIAMYQPYRALARCAKWANSDSGRFRKWFVAPIVAVLIAIVIQVMAGLVVLTDGADGSSSNATIGAAILLAVSFTLPWLAWMFFGNRAMRSLESGVANVHDRALRESQDPAAVNPILTGHVAAAAVGASAVSVPNA